MSVTQTPMTANAAGFARAGAAAAKLSNPKDAAAGAVMGIILGILGFIFLPFVLPVAAAYGDMPSRVPLNPKDEPMPVRGLQWASAWLMALFPLLLLALSRNHPAIVIAISPALVVFAVSPFLLGRRFAAAMGVPMTLKTWVGAVWGEIHLNLVRLVAITVTPVMVTGGLVMTGWVPVSALFFGGGLAWAAILFASVTAARRSARDEVDLRMRVLGQIMALATALKIPAKDLLEGTSTVTPTPDGGIVISQPSPVAVLHFDDPQTEIDLAKLLPELELATADLTAIVFAPASAQTDANRAAFKATRGMLGAVQTTPGSDFWDRGPTPAPASDDLDFTAGIPTAGAGLVSEGI